MFYDVKDAIEYIESKRTKRTFLDFKEIVERYDLLKPLPQMIHVAGTNGKGSTTIFIRDLLMVHGYHVGTFTSPYIVCHNERISVDGKAIPDDKLLGIINQLYPMIEKENLSMFEIDVCIMLVYFQQVSLDYCVIECGIGGKNDKTNVLDGIVSLITNIGYDHQFMLGDTLRQIAMHKAGIIKNHCPLYTTETNNDIKNIFLEQCQKKQSECHFVEAKYKDTNPYQLVYKDKWYTLPLPKYQINNLSLALNVVDSLIDLNENKIQSVIDHFQWPCRFEQFGHIYLDGAHNIDGIKALVQTIKDKNLEDVGIVFSALNDKDIKDMLDLLADYDVMCVSFEDERSRQGTTNYQTGLKQMQEKHQNVVVTGSLHFVSVVRKYVISTQ